MSPLDLGRGLNVILDWDWISSLDLRFLCPNDAMAGTTQARQATLLHLSNMPTHSPARPAATPAEGQGRYDRRDDRPSRSNTLSATYSAQWLVQAVEASRGGRSSSLQGLDETVADKPDAAVRTRLSPALRQVSNLFWMARSFSSLCCVSSNLKQHSGLLVLIPTGILRLPSRL
jgi:hypothetical protein